MVVSLIVRPPTIIRSSPADINKRAIVFFDNAYGSLVLNYVIIRIARTRTVKPCMARAFTILMQFQPMTTFASLSF